jgi:preprotein translocase subunit SecE
MADNNKNGSDKSKAAQSKPAQTSDNRQGQKKERTGLFAYLRGVRREFSKVVWPTREELTTDTVVVFACVAFFAAMFWLIDTGFLAALKGILGITLS